MVLETYVADTVTFLCDETNYTLCAFDSKWKSAKLFITTQNYRGTAARITNPLYQYPHV